MSKRLTTEEFIERAKLVHNNKYDYSKVKYKNARNKVCIICPEHGEFWQMPSIHLSGFGCKKCSIVIISKKNTLTTEEFIERAKLVHNNKYDYSKVKYKNARNKVCIICPEHGEFWQMPYLHLQKHGCSKCKGSLFYNKYKLGVFEFIQKTKSIHNNKYDYSKVNYINSHVKVCIICPDHGEFWQIPHSHLKGHGCFICSESKGERKIKNYLLENEVKFEREKKFNDCKNKRSLPFDFYLPNYNLLIEYDGEQHFKSINYFGGEKSLQKIKINDNIKNNYCKDNNLTLLRINYNENAEKKLTETLRFV